MGGGPHKALIVSTATDATTGTYWEVSSDGERHHAFANADLEGSMGASRLNKPNVGMAAA
jgi:hypothetical protein